MIRQIGDRLNRTSENFETSRVDAAYERRTGQRLRTVYRVARVFAGGDRGLARVHNISDEGLMLSTSLNLCLGDAMNIDLSESCSMLGKVVWHGAGRCGIKLAAGIDSAATLKWLLAERRAGVSRPMRLVHSKMVVIESALGVQSVMLCDVSQAGMKIAHDGRFAPGLTVKIQLRPDMQRRGVIRCSHAGFAGIALTELLSVEELGSLRAI